MHVLRVGFKHKCQTVVETHCHLPLHTTTAVDTSRTTIISHQIQSQEEVTQQTGVPGELSEVLGRMSALESEGGKTA